MLNITIDILKKNSYYCVLLSPAVRFCLNPDLIIVIWHNIIFHLYLDYVVLFYLLKLKLCTMCTVYYIIFFYSMTFIP